MSHAPTRRERATGFDHTNRFGRAWALVSVVLAATSSACSASRAVVARADMPLEAVAADAVSLAQPLIERGWTPGVAVALVSGDSTTFVSLGTSTAGGDAIDERTVFDIGSLTKVFTALLLADEVARGGLTLDTRLGDVLHGVPAAPWPGSAITLGQLATHRAGLPEWPRGFDFGRHDDPFVGYDAARLLSELAATPLGHAPGEGEPAYSSLGMGLLGLALEQHTGRDYESLVIERIARPLEMTHTTIDVDGASSRAIGHDDETRPVAAWSWSDRALVGAGAFRSTATDMARFVRAHLRATTEAPLASALRLAARPHYALVGGGHVGLAWGIEDDSSFSHEGQTNGFHAWVGIDVARRCGVVVLTNAMGGPVAGLGRRLLDRLRGRTLKPLSVPAAIDVGRAQRARHVGGFVTPDGTALEVSEDTGGLRLAIAGGRAYRLYASSPSRWFLRVGDIAITFEEGAAVLDVAGREIRAMRAP